MKEVDVYMPLITKKQINIQSRKLIGEGAFGKVFLDKDMDGKPYVIKKAIQFTSSVFCNFIQNTEVEKRMKLEAQTLKKVYEKILKNTLKVRKLQNKTFHLKEMPIPKLLEIENSPRDEIYLEYIEGKKLNDSCLDKFDILKKLAEGVHAIHEAGYVHRDLKSDNILFDKDMNIKIIDFGLVTPMKDENSIPIKDNGSGTAPYMPPSVYDKDSYLSPKRDMYAIGGVMLDFIFYPINLYGHNMEECITTIIPQIRKKELVNLSKKKSKVSRYN